MITPKHYAFRSTWLIPAPVDVVWAVLANPATWQQWWPGLSQSEVLQLTPEGVGSRARTGFNAVFGYRIEFISLITVMKINNLVEFEASGDLEGRGRLKFSEAAGQTTIEIDWQVVTTKRWMNLWAPVLRPLFVWGHNHLMRAGQRGLERYISPRGL